MILFWREIFIALSITLVFYFVAGVIVGLSS